MTETITQRSPEEIRSAREAQRTWYGVLADDNVEHIVDRIRTMLTGRSFTFVANYADTGQPPTVRTGQRLRPGTADRDNPLVYRRNVEDDGFCGISVCDTYGVWMTSTRFATEAEGHQAREEDEKSTTYFLIEGGREGDAGSREHIEITLFAGAGRIHWVITPEPPAMDLEDAVYQLERLGRIGIRRRDQSSDRDWQWFVDHPLNDATLSPNTWVPAVADWLRGGAR